MFNVKTEKMLQDYKELCAKLETNCKAIEQAARSFAISRMYDAETTEKFIAYVQDIEGGGLMADESEKLDFLAGYVEQVDDVIHDEDATTEA